MRECRTQARPYITRQEQRAEQSLAPTKRGNIYNRNNTRSGTQAGGKRYPPAKRKRRGAGEL